jgi:hypothetical protein
MFDRFRQKYPQGSITSSLIQIHNDQYIVSVSIKVDGVILATTLAADEQIQLAEARATAQALQTLSIGEIELSVDPDFSSSAQSIAPPIAVEPVRTELPLTRQPVVPPAPEPVIIEEAIDLPTPPRIAISAEIPEEVPAIPTAAEPPLPEPEVVTEKAIDPEPSADIEPAPKAAKNKKAAVVQEDSAPTYDELPAAQPALSVTDMIPLINMELKRLAWSREKGRDCIIELYNKRSSSLLSDEELLGLLRYLQDQPTPD